MMRDSYVLSRHSARHDARQCAPSKNDSRQVRDKRDMMRDKQNWSATVRDMTRINQK